MTPSILDPLHRSLRVAKRTPQAYHGVEVRYRILKFLLNEGPASVADIAEELSLSRASTYKHIRRLYPELLHVRFWDRRYSARGPSGWTAVFAPCKLPDAPYPAPEDPKQPARRKPGAAHTWGIKPQGSAQKPATSG